MTTVQERIVVAVAALAVVVSGYAFLDFMVDNPRAKATTPTTVGWCPQAHPEDPQWTRIEAKLDCLGERR